MYHEILQQESAVPEWHMQYAVLSPRVCHKLHISTVICPHVQ